jgi:hypothetical protein
VLLFRLVALNGLLDVVVRVLLALPSVLLVPSSIWNCVPVLVKPRFAELEVILLVVGLVGAIQEDIEKVPAQGDCGDGYVSNIM